MVPGVFLESVYKREEAHILPIYPTIPNSHQSRQCYWSASIALTSRILKEYTLLLSTDGLKLEIQRHICKKIIVKIFRLPTVLTLLYVCVECVSMGNRSS